MKTTQTHTIATLYRKIVSAHSNLFAYDERKELKNIFIKFSNQVSPKEQNIEKHISTKIKITEILLSEIGLGKAAVLSILLHEMVEKKLLSVEEIEKTFNTQISSIMQGMIRVQELYARNSSLETENFRKLFLTFAQDIRVILIIIAEHLQTMRELDTASEEDRQNTARESSFLYAPLAHRMGLYAIKTELEDLSLKYTNRDIYREIATKINETKSSRDQFISEFITPLKQKIEALGFTFEIKGRTKSINSIYNKIKKQNTPFENIYDLFAIRIIFDVPFEKEKAACWQAYSIVADMYQPNPKRLRDWLSIPKTNGYESLHTTVLGPEGRWVEVQIRSVRMDEVAEKGLAAHWKYKGIKSESGMDEWLKNIREILENPELNAVDFMDEFKLNLYDKEVFVFTPNGDLHKLPKGATALDFAFSIHTALGSKCVGAQVNGKNMPIKYVLNNGDQVKVLTSPTQKPNPAWLKVVTTSRAKTKIRQALKDVEFKDAEMGRETIVRRFKNWKIELDDGKLSRLAKKKGFKTVSDFYQEIAHEKLDMHIVRDAYLDLDKQTLPEQPESRKADSFSKDTNVETSSKEDVLVIGENLKGIDFKLANCCHPIYGDDVFGFVSVSGGIKIHRTDCPNAPQMIARLGYRIVNARWSGKSIGSQYPITLHIVGHDDIGIVTNVTSLISKEKNISLRSISIDSSAGLFQGNLTIMVSDTKELEDIVKKIKLVKGVKSVSR
ncbi:MAG: bifunctional (p)ppGpp synthetase/guanosine-3',5'-bis(diphosphate) 3'-pyrophosphohydrolase [Paludibacter sp.]|nr:bifunctional (p)ppGpp synthetase/guanosine-3',5'-bis(diphosphate) 3'-pyrophosphohydrolase [Paludibacter sp.]